MNHFTEQLTHFPGDSVTALDIKLRMSDLDSNLCALEEELKPERSDLWPADKLWQAGPNALRYAVGDYILQYPNVTRRRPNEIQPLGIFKYNSQLLQFYRQEMVTARESLPDIYIDAQRYVGFPLVEAVSVVERLKHQVNDLGNPQNMHFDWLNLGEPEVAAMNQAHMPPWKREIPPRYKTLKELMHEIRQKTGTDLNAELHDEKSAQQTQYYITSILLDSTDINWPARSVV